MFVHTISSESLQHNFLEIKEGEFYIEQEEHIVFSGDGKN